MAWARTYDITTPDGSVDSPAEAADRMNEIKAALQERLDVDHFFPLTGSEVSDTDAGEHRKITIRTLTAVAVAALTATKAYLYRLVTDGELYFKDDDDNTIQLTSGGKILSASLDMKDEDDMASDSAVHTSTQQAIKAYADAVAAAATAEIAAAIAAAVAANVTLSAYTDEDSDNNAMLKTHAYKAATSGIVEAYVTPSGVGQNIRGYVGATDDPVGAGTQIQYRSIDGAGNVIGFTMHVAEDEYFELRTSSANAINIQWKSYGTLSKPIDQD